MTASELLRGQAPFVADTSAWWRISSLPAELGQFVDGAILADRLWITPIVRMEILYSARSSAEYIAIESELDALRILRNRRRGRSLLTMEPDPYPGRDNDPFEGPTFSASSTTFSISRLYVRAHDAKCRKHQQLCYRELSSQHLAKLRRLAWRAVRQNGLYVCSHRSLRPPLLQARRSSSGTTKARILFHASALAFESHSTLARRTFIRPVRVIGAC